jgi:hypothetical protein
MTRILRRLLLGLLAAAAVFPALAASSAKPARYTVTAGEVTDRRRNDGNFASLEIELKLGGDGLEAVQGARAVVRKAVDDTGRSLLQENRQSNDFQKPSGETPGLKIELKNPARRAATLKEVSGQVELFVPDRDAASTVKVDRFLSRLDRPIASPALKAAGAEVMVVSRKMYDEEKKKDEERRKKEAEGAGIAGAMAQAFGSLFSGMFGEIGENDLLIKVDDENKKVFAIEAADASGKKIDNRGTMQTSGFWILSYGEKLPPDATLKIYLMTPRALVSTPFALKDVTLP